MEVFRKRIEAANTLILITESDTNRLRDVKHIGDVVPAVRIVHGRQIVINHARPILFKQSYQRIRARPAIEPQGEGIFGRGLSRFEEPVENMNL